MPAFPDFDPAGIGYDVQLWHPEWGPVHVSIGMPSYPAGVCDSPAVDDAVRTFAAALLTPIHGEKIIEIIRVQTEATKWTPPPPTPSTP
ncbi:hypothetical protein ACIQCR_24550 [Streptomyces sp. NPDC093249]|uniref:hypothetical protein n=1 Tax=unclassified Streptomyces TaxID=2593676 RepID=UPI00381A1333